MPGGKGCFLTFAPLVGQPRWLPHHSQNVVTRNCLRLCFLLVSGSRTTLLSLLSITIPTGQVLGQPQSNRMHGWTQSLLERHRCPDGKAVLAPCRTCPRAGRWNRSACCCIHEVSRAESWALPFLPLGLPTRGRLSFVHSAPPPTVQHDGSTLLTWTLRGRG